MDMAVWPGTGLFETENDSIFTVKVSTESLGKVGGSAVVHC